MLTYEKDDALALDGVNGFNRGITEFNLKPNVADVAQKLVTVAPDSLIIVSSGTNTVDVIKAIRARGGQMQIMTLSNNSSQDFIPDLGADASGIIVSQITPPLNLLTTVLD